mmetsp:Transcript_30950/g.78266  ORF Transcript_30950/g.78266 Transcript_30950/m.78266 type:complete len:235 (-) Transcript_30950:669-1373(-)
MLAPVLPRRAPSMLRDQRMLHGHRMLRGRCEAVNSNDLAITVHGWRSTTTKEPAKESVDESASVNVQLDTAKTCWRGGIDLVGRCQTERPHKPFWRRFQWLLHSRLHKIGQVLVLDAVNVERCFVDVVDETNRALVCEDGPLHNLAFCVCWDAINIVLVKIPFQDSLPRQTERAFPPIFPALDVLRCRLAQCLTIHRECNDFAFHAVLLQLDCVFGVGADLNAPDLVELGGTIS